MENLEIKTSGLFDPKSNGTNDRDKATLEKGLKESFQDLISKAGASFGTNLAGLADGISTTAFLNHAKVADYRREPSSSSADANRAPESSNANNQHDDTRFESARADNGGTAVKVRDDSGHHSDPVSHNDDHTPHSRDTVENKGADSDTAGHENNHADSNAASNDETGTSDRDSAAPDNQNKKDAKQSSDGAANEDQAALNATGAAGQTVVNAHQGNLNIAAALQGAKTSKVQAGAGEIAPDKAAENPVNAAAGAIKQNSKQGASAGQSHNLGQSTQTAQASQTGVDASTRGITAAQQQGAELTKVIGGTNKTQVSVSVNNDAETLVSRPGASLTAGTILTTTSTQGQSQGNTQGNTHQAGPGQNAAQASATTQIQAAQQQAQAQQNANQNAQTQTGIQAAGVTKGGATGLQTAQAASAGGTAGGGETALSQLGATSATNSTQQTQQNQQSQQAQTSQNARASTTHHPVVDQISVKISKALHAGADRISVQLKPAELGRVDVKMELGHDGRIMAVVTADNKDTLDLLKRDSGDLQRALENAGMQLDSGDLSFNLRGDESQYAEQQNNTRGQNGPIGKADKDEDDLLDAAFITEQNTDISKGRIDVKA